MKFVLILTGLFALIALVVSAPQGIPNGRIRDTYERIFNLMTLEFGDNPPVDPNSFAIYDIPMRDGITLRTRVWIPRDYQPGEKRAAILDRTPYGPIYTAMSLIWTFDGYIIVMQDQRGTTRSQGQFEIWRKDGQDAYDTMEWISKQEWSNGKVMSFGVSADGISIYPQILYDNPWIAAQFPIFGVDNGYKLVYPGGVLIENLVEKWLEDLCDECIPLVKENEKDGEFWDPVNMTSHYGNVHFPSVHWAGWYDIFGEGQIQAFNGYKKQGQEAYRKDTFLFVEPHGHCYDVVFFQGISLLGLKLGRQIFKLAATGVRDPLLDQVKGLNVFILGSVDRGLLNPGNYFTSFDDWPAYQSTIYYLSDDRTLSNEVPNSASFSYKYDPSSPAPTQGGNNLFGTCGALDQVNLEIRPDFVAFTTKPLSREVAILGPITANLFVSTSANDTDILLKLTDVYPDGRSILIQEGSLRLKWRGDKRVDPVLVTPGEVYEVKIDILRAGIIFARGHSIRLSITSSNSPRFNKNLNNGNLIVEGGEPYVAQTTIYVGKDYPSRITLPVVTQDQIPPAAYNFGLFN